MRDASAAAGPDPEAEAEEGDERSRRFLGNSAVAAISLARAAAVECAEPALAHSASREMLVETTGGEGRSDAPSLRDRVVSAGPES